MLMVPPPAASPASARSLRALRKKPRRGRLGPFANLGFRAACDAFAPPRLLSSCRFGTLSAHSRGGLVLSARKAADSLQVFCSSDEAADIIAADGWRLLGGLGRDAATRFARLRAGLVPPAASADVHGGGAFALRVGLTLTLSDCESSSVRGVSAWRYRDGPGRSRRSDDGDRCGLPAIVSSRRGQKIAPLACECVTALTSKPIGLRTSAPSHLFFHIASKVSRARLRRPMRRRRLRPGSKTWACREGAGPVPRWATRGLAFSSSWIPTRRPR